LGVLGDFISKMAAAGAMVPDAELDNYLRNLANLPKRSETEGNVMGQAGMETMQGAPPLPNGAPAPGMPTGAPAPAPVDAGTSLMDKYAPFPPDETPPQ
jgi:hypothetical protein